MKELIVMKFGGTALATPSRIKLAAQKILKRSQLYRVVVVVSAMGDETDRLLALTQNYSGFLNRAGIDTVIAAGEQIAAGLMTLALGDLGEAAQSFLAHQVPLVTDSNFSDGRILRVECANLLKTVNEGIIPVVAGFQGIDAEQRLVTLGRGGSDTSAVAIAAALQAEACELYKDVDGIYSADPHRHQNARRFANLTYREMERIAEREPQILHYKAVRLARLHQVRLHVRSAFSDAPGTIIETKHIEEMSA